MTMREQPDTIHAFQDDALGDHDATALADRIRRGDVSVREVAVAAIDRARQVEPFIQGIVFEAFEQAVHSEPQPADGFFRGVPTFIKDNMDVAGMPTRHGSAAVPPQAAAKTGAVAEQILAQGYLCLGKSALPEFGFNASTEHAGAPPSRNPWNLAFSTGASSGGSAALVAAGVVPIAHANDGGGSIRIPAACCGLVGLKPSRGRLVDNEAAKALPINIVCDGVVTRSVRDTARFYAEAERHFRNRKLPELGMVKGPSAKPKTIGLVLDSINGHPTDQATRETVEHTARLLESMGHRIVPMDVPIATSFPEDFARYWGMLAFGVKANGRKLMHPGFDKTRVDGLTNGLDRMFRKQFYKLPATLWRLRRSFHEYARAMEGFDAVLTPVLGHTTPEIGYLSPEQDFDQLFDRLTRYVSFTPLANATGAPAIALPMGQSRDNLPVAVHLMGCHGGERTLLELAYALEEAQPWPSLARHMVQAPAVAVE
ncbi:amidase [Marinobacter lipolyticus]|mgnify:CR=1 FL=1|uniref:amidase n=1 Tax=Marinobacter lipolyticus TaxID=209639 RepID=UPI002B1CE020|nr:amidase [Marinobacter lipolyticus]